MWTTVLNLFLFPSREAQASHMWVPEGPVRLGWLHGGFWGTCIENSRHSTYTEGIGYPLQYSWASVVAQLVKNQPAMQERDLGSIPALGRIPWRRERLPTPVFWPGEFHGLYSPWGRRVGHDWATFTTYTGNPKSVLGDCEGSLEPHEITLSGRR